MQHIKQHVNVPVTLVSLNADGLYFPVPLLTKPCLSITCKVGQKDVYIILVELSPPLIKDGTISSGELDKQVNKISADF